MPSLFTASEWLAPAAIAMTLVRPETVTGLVRFVVLPSPSWPREFEPKAFTVPSERSTSTCSLPEAIAATFVRPVTSSGVRLSLVVPWPSWPEAPRPQAKTRPSARSATEWPSPAAKAIAVGLARGVGSRRVVVLPSPSWP